MLASLAVVDTGVRPRPRGASSDERPGSSLGEGCREGVAGEFSDFTFLSSVDGLGSGLLGVRASSGTAVLAEGLDGRVGGEGGMSVLMRCTLLGGTMGCSQRYEAWAVGSADSVRWIVLPLGRENLE